MNNNATDNGGGVYNLNGFVNIDVCNVTSNFAMDNGGGLDAKHGSYNIKNSLINSNTGKDGAGVYVHFGNVKLLSSTVSSNAGEYGAGLCCEDGDINLTDTSIVGNVASLNAGGTYNINGSVNINNCDFTNNTANSNGGGLDTRHGNSTIVNSRFSDNKANYGGGAYNRDGFVAFDRCNFINNHASVDGGGFCCDDHNLDTITNTNFTGNSATSKGGGVDNENGELKIDNSSFTRNTASDGGAIKNQNSQGVDELDIIDSTFSGNVASFRGGAIYNDKDSSMSIKGSTLNNNSILDSNSGDNGGAIFNGEGDLNIIDSTFKNNVAKPGNGYYGQHGCGGAIDNFGGNLIVANSVFSDNHARFGGAINSYYAYLKLVNCQITDNIADSVGGGVCSNAGIQDIDTQTKSNFSSNKPNDIFHFNS
ncbi:MAG: hypothetical protein LBB45_01400 [Methanobrevibacter sp.]|jgi:predicted outer membrane repeat protein|nr:hypothetical protein [Candidatus Methanovirga basalitermitum]